VKHPSAVDQHFAEAFAQITFQHLAGRVARQCVGKDDAIRDLPFGDLIFEDRQNFCLARVLAFRFHCNQDRTFVPFFVTGPDDGRIRDLRVTDRDIFKLDRADPFAARLDDIF